MTKLTGERIDIDKLKKKVLSSMDQLGTLEKQIISEQKIKSKQGSDKHSNGNSKNSEPLSN